MSLYEPGRICVKVAGREAGSYCVIVEKKEDNYVIITGPKELTGIRRRSCNVRHLEPLETVLQIKSGADDPTVEKAIAEAGLTDQFKTKIRF